MKVTSQIWIADLRRSDILPREDLTQIHLVAVETDAAAVRHGHRRVVKGIGQVVSQEGHQ